jgi:hypothetical protein
MSGLEPSPGFLSFWFALWALIGFMVMVSYWR